MKKIILLLAIACGVAFSCDTNKTAVAGTASEKPVLAENDTIHISNKEAEFDVVIFDPGFNTWFNLNARPKNFYTQNFLETRNRAWVTEWNARVTQQSRYGGIYDFPINYYSGIDYGLDVNYMIYNYLTYFQLKYNQRLGSFAPRI